VGFKRQPAIDCFASAEGLIETGYAPPSNKSFSSGERHLGTKQPSRLTLSKRNLSRSRFEVAQQFDSSPREINAGPKGLFRSDRKWMIRLAGNSGFSVVSRIYLLIMPIAGSRHAPSTFDSRPVLKVAQLMPQRLRVVVK
jgi:hypothetical protein